MPKIFADRLNELMDLEGITSFGLAQATGLPLKSVHNWTRGVFYPNAKGLLLLANYFRISVDYLLGESDVLEEKAAKGITVEQAQENVVKKLEEYRMNKGIKYGRLSKLLGVGQCTLTRWFNEKAMPETTMLIRIAKLLEISIDELLGRE